VQHDKPTEVLDALKTFLEVPVKGEPATLGPSPVA
jgi:hypothetical protein